MSPTVSGSHIDYQAQVSSSATPPKLPTLQKSTAANGAPSSTPISKADRAADATFVQSELVYPSQIALLSDLPSMVSSFDEMPHQLQSFVILELLKRCPSSTLQFVSSLVVPTLKRDFIALLPIELSYQVLSYLDLKSLGRCSAVSSVWKHVLEAEGCEVAVWKQRLIAEQWYNEKEVRREVANLVRRHHKTRSNWLNGRYKTISFPGHGNNVVTCLQFDDDKIVSGSDDMTIHIYETNTGRLRKKLVGHEGGVWALQYWEDSLVSGSTDRSVRVWDMDTGLCTHVFDGHTSTVRCLMVLLEEAATSGKVELPFPIIVTGSRDATLRVWRLPNPKVDPPYQGSSAGPNPYFMHALNGHSASVRAIAGHGRVLISGSYDCTVRMWDLVSGECVRVFLGHRERVYSVGYCHELERAVSGSLDASVRVWCTKTGAALFNLEGHTSLVGLLELSPKYLVSAAADTTLRVWSPTTGQCLATLNGHTAPITCLHHDPTLNRIVSGSEGGVKVWELSSADPGGSGGPNGPQPVYGHFLRDIVTNTAGVWRVRMDERRLVTAMQREGQATWFEVLDFGTD
ncbi:WD40-repeat-containing domain protein, partial [Zopfochytrium polystomum]